MFRLLNAGFGLPIGVNLLDEILSLNYDGIRQDIPMGSTEIYIHKLLKEISDSDCYAVLILGGWMHRKSNKEIVDLYRKNPINFREVFRMADKLSHEIKGFGIAHRVWIEIGNEPDLTNDFSKDPMRFASYVSMLYGRLVKSCPELKDRVIAGGVSNLRKKTGYKYLRDYAHQSLPDQIIFGIHPYRTEVKPEDPFDKWERINDAVWDVKQHVLKGRKFAVTEIGWHSAIQQKCGGWFKPRMEYEFSDDEIAKFIKWEMNFWKKEGSELFAWYQLNDGPDDIALHHYGIRNLSGDWKTYAKIGEQDASRYV
ncbi:MAG: hypothetical protein ACXACX_09255 [Candidatus Hodarchaeales archaeon]|jgi:hypothetical protein